MSDPTRPLSGKSALITGASRGIGLSIATELAARGAAVTLTGRKAEPLEAAAAASSGSGLRPVMVTAAPRAASAVAIDRPMPRLAPVIKADFPDRVRVGSLMSSA